MENTLQDQYLRLKVKDHLHTRGEYSEIFKLHWHTMGSPPHSWRILDQISCLLLVPRITSTLVENTGNMMLFTALKRDHLHTRGEYYIRAYKGCAFKGSPPHSWRIREAYDLSEKNLGITSTLVENTQYLELGFYCRRDHLHTRGEYGILMKISSLMVGSPPHSWRIH